MKPDFMKDKVVKFTRGKDTVEGKVAMTKIDLTSLKIIINSEYNGSTDGVWVWNSIKWKMNRVGKSIEMTDIRPF